MNSSFHFGNSPGFADSSPSESHINIREKRHLDSVIGEIVCIRSVFVIKENEQVIDLDVCIV